MDGDFVSIAKIARPHGLKGWVVADLLTDFPERFENVNDAFVGKTAVKLQDFRHQNGRIALKFAGFDSIESVEPFRNLDVRIPESEAVELESDEFYDWQLAECEVKTVDGETLGRVTDVMRTGAAEILVVAGAAKEYLIPFANTICTDVDLQNKLITVDPPEGLLEL